MKRTEEKKKIKVSNICFENFILKQYKSLCKDTRHLGAVMNEVNKLSLLKADLITCTGKTVNENISNCFNKNTDVIRPVESPYSRTGGISVLKGKLEAKKT